MITCEYAGPPVDVVRSHPWTDAAQNPAFRYYDLTKSPDLIRSVLEDFVPFSAHPAIETFYRLLGAVNVPDGLLETNDCAFTGPCPNDNTGVRKTLQCSGRLMLLFRSLRRNRIAAEMEQLTLALHRHLSRRDPLFRFGIVGTSIVPVRYRALGTQLNGQSGTQLMISFWAFGNTEIETMKNLDRLMKNLSASIAHVCGSDLHYLE